MASVVLGVVGSYFGPVGSMVGSLIGSYIDQQLFSSKKSGSAAPAMNDLAVMDASYGQPRPRYWGKVRFAGNLVWKGAPVDVAATDGSSGGKGGSSSPATPATRYVSFAVGLGAAPVGGIDGIDRIYFNKKLAWQVGGTGNYDQYISFTTGAETDLPPATIEAVEGIGNVPGYRGTPLIIFTAMPLVDFGNQIPQVEVVALARTDASLVYDGSFQVKTDAPNVAENHEWRNRSSAPDAFGNLVLTNSFSRNVMVISPAGATVWTKTAADVLADISALAGGAPLSDMIHLDTAGVVNDNYILIIGESTRDGASFWSVAALYQAVASGSPALVGWYRANKGVTGLPYTVADRIMVMGKRSDDDAIMVSGTLDIGGTDQGWAVWPSVNDFRRKTYLGGYPHASGYTWASYEVAYAVLMFAGTTGTGYKNFIGSGPVTGPYNGSSQGGWVLPKLVPTGQPGVYSVESHLYIYLSYGWMLANATAGLGTNDETSGVLAAAHPGGCVIDISLGADVSYLTFVGTLSAGEHSKITPIGASYGVVNADFVDKALVAQLPFDEEGRFATGGGTKGDTSNSYEMMPSITQAPSGKYLVAFQMLHNANTTDTAGKTLWPLSVRAFSYDPYTAIYTQVGHSRGVIYSATELGVGGGDGYPDDNTRMLWWTAGTLYVWGITGIAAVTAPEGTAYLTKFGKLSLDGVALLSDVFSDICEAAGLNAATDFDVSALGTMTTEGYLVGSSANCAAALQQLMAAYAIIAVEEDDKVKFKPRSATPIASVAEADLGARSGDEVTVKVKADRAQDTDLPGVVTVKYFDAAADYQTGAQQERRNALATFSLQESTLALPIVLTPDEGKALARRIVYDAWIGRNTIDVRVMPWYAIYSNGDVLTFTWDDGASVLDAMITTADEGIDGVIEMQARAIDGIVLAAPGTGSAPSVPPPQTITPSEAMTIQFVDGPLLRDADDSPGYYIPARGETPAWKGGTVYISQQSVDTDFRPLVSFNVAAPMGLAETVLADATAGVFDTTNTVQVALYADATLSSASEADVLAGTNWAMLGDELIGFATVTQDAAGVYTLSDILRGMKNTAPFTGTHALGERFVALRQDGSVKSININFGEIGELRYFRAVSFGQSVADVTSIAFTPASNRSHALPPVTAVPATPTGLTATGGTQQNALSWNANAPSDGVTAYKLYGALGHSVAFGSTAVLATINALGWTHTGLGVGEEWSYYLVAENVAGDSGHEGPVDGTTASTSSQPYIINAGSDGALTDGDLLFDHVAVVPFTLPASLTGSYGGVDLSGAAPTADNVITLYKNGSSIGTVTLPAAGTLGNNTATFSFSGSVSFAAGDHFRALNQATADATMTKPFITFYGTR